MIKTIKVCDHCNKVIDDNGFAIAMLCKSWDNGLDFCHIECLWNYMKNRQREMGNCT